MQENYNVGIYCRLSREDERSGESVSVENQRIMLERYVHEQGWNLYSTYCDDGVSGTTFDRPGFNQLIADATAGKINLVLCKDLSRLGRDYIEAGKYTDVVFPSLGCRFIALNDGVDTIHKNNEMLVILKNVMNDLYARDTSNKIRAVKQSTFKAGKYVGCYAPIGYRKSPEDKHILEIDPVTAPVVRRIFDMRLQGDSFRKIARTLNEEGVPSPRGFYYMAEGRPNLRGETPYWNDVTVKTILRNEVYLGHMVQNKTGTVSYKVHKQINKPKEEWVRVENTHEPLITPEDRAATIEAVKARLADPSDTDWTLVATSCLEAGVDFSFRTGFREAASLLSLLQAAGRVNRSGRWPGSEMWSFQLQDDPLLKGNLRLGDATRVLTRYFERGDPITPQHSTTSIVDELNQGGLASEKIRTLRDAETNGAFETMEREFVVIDADTVPVVVDAALASAVAHGDADWRQLQKRSVSIWRHRVKELCLPEIAPGVFQWNLDYDPFLGYMAGALAWEGLGSAVIA